MVGATDDTVIVEIGTGVSLAGVEGCMKVYFVIKMLVEPTRVTFVTEAFVIPDGGDVKCEGIVSGAIVLQDLSGLFTVI